MHKPLIWNGMETIHIAKRLLAARSSIAVQLPADFHHTLFAHFYPDAGSGQVEAIDIVGGPEVLEEIGKIRGLEAVTDLIQPIAQAGAKVRLVSPSPCIEINY